ncbi:LysE/ArgO family amino acid transporter [Planktotalea sp.]|uniref:LysE/ArgO family amino acid transporter n=1 Tax=Planktotalea sp. TaxID=2029877 RepID=UPI003296998C
MSSFFPSFLPGFLLSISLILAIGAQNAFVLKHGLRKQHVLPIVLVCAISDAILIISGVAGFGTLASKFPMFETIMRYGGAIFLFWYGFQNAMSAWRGGASLKNGADDAAPLRTTLLTLLAITWLNPHVYLDTVVLIGSISAQYEDRVAFGAGATLGSFVFFVCLGYGARLLSPIFAKPSAWRILDAIIALTMWAIAISLLI